MSEAEVFDLCQLFCCLWCCMSACAEATADPPPPRKEPLLRYPEEVYRE